MRANRPLADRHDWRRCLPVTLLAGVKSNLVDTISRLSKPICCEKKSQSQSDRVSCLHTCGQWNYRDCNCMDDKASFNCDYYRPQTKLRKGNVFTPVCHSVHIGGVHPPLADTPLSRHPPGRHPPGRHPCPGDGHCSGQYASYWNAFLFFHRSHNLIDGCRTHSL